jgi:hypothetical protein
MKTGKMVPYLFVTAPILESYVRMCIPPLYRKPGKRVAVEVDGTIDSILVWAVKWRNFTTLRANRRKSWKHWQTN